jgi:glycosyltransferase involved in cell wall biosynthesis
MKIYLCTTEPSKNYRSWSNIPYLLQKNLEKRGFRVENHVMRELEPFKTLFNLPVRFLNRFFGAGTTYYYVRTPMHFYCTLLYSRFIGLISSRQDIMVVQGFSYPLKNGKNKQIAIGDWPSEYLFEKFLKREPSQLERKSIDRENSVIEAADAVITLFPNVYKYMQDKYRNKNIFYFGNVINVDEEVAVPADIKERKPRSRKFVFIGQAYYLSGALELIEAAYKIREDGYNCEVDIIGIDESLIGKRYNWLRIHGYLDKGKAEDKKKYYEILSEARLFVNTTQGWSGFQSLLEAMYFYTPIVVRPNESLISYFTDISDFAYILNDEKTRLESILKRSLTDNEDYIKRSATARSAVKDSTWNNFTTSLVSLFQ